MIYAVLGPTCSGKSDLAEFLSQKLGYPVINFDAFQVYKELDKGTAKPSKELLDSNRYYLYSFKSITENYDVSQYQTDARNLLSRFNNDNVILVGGTGLYLKALLFDYKFEDEKRMPDDFLSNKTNEELFDELMKIDPDDAKKIGVNNRKRLIRALYIYSIHGKNKSELNDNGKDNLLYKNVVFIGIDINRDILYERINKRVDIMFENGLKDEANNLFMYYGNSLRAFQAIGYKEFNNSLLSDDEIKELIKKNTRNYAKRQLTFFRHQFKDVKWCKNLEEITQVIENKNE